MKQILVLLGLTLSISCISGCNNKNESVLTTDIPTADIDTISKVNSSIKTKEKIKNDNLVTTSIKILSKLELTVIYTNETKGTLSYGNPYKLYLLNKDNWKTIDILSNVGWEDILYNLKAGESFEDVINLENLYGKLKPGHYKLVKEMYTKSSKVINVETEFNIE